MTANCPVRLTMRVIPEEAPVTLRVVGGDEVNIRAREVELLEHYENDYERMRNLPQINGVTLKGDKNLSDLLPEGIILDGGSAEGAV